jgi:hypothetical protein
MRLLLPLAALLVGGSLGTGLSARAHGVELTQLLDRAGERVEESASSCSSRGHRA